MFRTLRTLLLVLFFLPLAALAEELISGIHYDPILPPVQVAAGKPEVVEVYNFQCPHCNHLRPVFDQWAAKNKDRYVIRHLPVYWGTQTDMPVRAFFTAEHMGKAEEMRTAIFKAYFEAKENIDKEDTMLRLAQEIGLDAQKFRENLNSFGMMGKVAQAKAQQRAYGINSTPMVVVNGKYKVDANNGGGSWEKMLEIVSQLAAKP